MAIVGGVRDQWPLFCAALDRVDLIDDPRYSDGYERTQNYDALIPDLEAAMSPKTRRPMAERVRRTGHPLRPRQPHRPGPRRPPGPNTAKP